MSDLVITESYEKLLLGVYHFYLATATQLCDLHWSRGSITMVKAKLKDLVDAGYLLSDKVPSKKPQSPLYYTLGTAGMSYLKGEGYDIPASMRASKEQDKQPTHIAHTLGLNSIIIDAMQLDPYTDPCWLAHFIHERALKQPRYKYDVVPDALLEFHRMTDRKQQRAIILLEYDRATEHINAFKGRIRGYVKMLRAEAYKDLYEVNRVRIAFTADNTTKLYQWTKEELTEGRSLQAYGGAFYFANLAPPLDLKTLWTEPVWKTLYTDELCSLLGS